jgi:predicted Fe-Mo cluster-binding NifX family protein
VSGEKLIVVSTEDASGFEGQVSGHFGRCPFFLLANAEGYTVTVSRVVPNPYYAAHEPGQVPHFIHELGADAIIAGGMGPRAIEMFHSFGIDVATGAIGTVSEVLGAYVRGEHRGVVPCAHDHPDSCGDHGQQTQPQTQRVSHE